MSDDLKKTIKIKRNRNVGSDSKGRTVWTKPIEEAEFELMSTQMLKQVLDSDDEDKKKQIRALAESEEGVLARAAGTNEFEVLPENELEEALQAANNPNAPNIPSEFSLESVGESGAEEELSLVSTQALRKVLNIEDDADDESETDESGGGYNPYDRG